MLIDRNLMSVALAGEGEFGIVHKALFHGTLVAAKILKGSSAIALGDFRSEIEVLRKVHHPNAVQFLGACTKQEPYILVTGDLPHRTETCRAAFNKKTLC